MKYFFSILAFHLLSISFAQNIESSIDSIFSEWKFPQTPGGALAVVKDGKITYEKGYGSADLEHDIAITPSTVFYIGSVSKQFVTFCILLLEEDGKLNLDDNIQTYFPDFPDYGSPLTIRHFIHHTSGVRDFLSLMDLKGRSYLDEISKEEVYQLIKQQKELNFEPGERYLYSNSCYFMLALIVEKVSGKPIRQFAQEQIFDPLGMKNSKFFDDNTKLIKNKAFSYQRNNNGDFENLINRFELVGSGGVYSTVEDLYLWDQNFYKNKLGNATQDIINKMQSEGLLNNGESSGYAFALNMGKYKGLKTVEHSGSLAGYRADLLRFPNQAFSVIILSNRSDADPVGKAYNVADIYLKDDFKIESTKQNVSKTKIGKPKTIFKAKNIIGSYEIEPGVSLEISNNNDTLKVTQNWNNVSYSLTKIEGNTYAAVSDADVHFVFSNLRNGTSQNLDILQNGRQTPAIRKEPFINSKLNLQNYIGT